MELIFPFYNFFNAWLYFTERNAQIVSRTEAIASLGLLQPSVPKILARTDTWSKMGEEY